MKPVWDFIPEALVASLKAILDVDHIRQVLEFLANGTPDGRLFIFTDLKTPGLQIRVSGDKASWYVKTEVSGKEFTKKIADITVDIHHATTITGPAKARELAGVILGFLKHGRENDVKPFLDAFYARKPAADTSRSIVPVITAALQELEESLQAERDRQRHAKSWTLQDCIDKTISEKSDLKSTAPINSKTVKDYRLTFGRAAFTPLVSKPVTEITAHDIEDVRDQVKEAAGIDAGRKVITYTRSVLNYCCSNHSASGLDKGNPWWRMLNVPWKSEPRTRRPELEDIVRSLILAEEYTTKPLPGRMVDKVSIRPGTLAALWWLVLTCQRSGAGLNLLGHDVVPDDKDENFVLAGWDAGVMKAGQTFLLPVPVEAWKMVDKWRSKGRNSHVEEWVFPSERDEKKHVTGSGVYRILYRLAGRAQLVQKELEKAAEEKAAARIAAGKKPRKRGERGKLVDLFAENGIEWWSPHDLRRSVTGAMNAHDIAGGASAILAHETFERESLKVTATEKTRKDFLARRQAKVTAIAYGHSQQLGLKKEAISIWCKAVLAEYHRQKSEEFRTAAE